MKKSTLVENHAHAMVRAKQFYAYYGLQAAAHYLRNNGYSVDAALWCLIYNTKVPAKPDTVWQSFCFAGVDSSGDSHV